MPVLVNNGFGTKPALKNINNSNVFWGYARHDILKGDIVFTNASGITTEKVRSNHYFQQYDYPLSVGYALEDIKIGTLGKIVLFLRNIDER